MGTGICLADAEGIVWPLRKEVTSQSPVQGPEDVERRRDAGDPNYDSLKVAKCLVIQLVTRMNGFVRFPLSLSTV